MEKIDIATKGWTVSAMRVNKCVFSYLVLSNKVQVRGGEMWSGRCSEEQEVINECSWKLERRVLPTETSVHSLNSTARCGPALDRLVPAPPLGVSPTQQLHRLIVVLFLWLIAFLSSKQGLLESQLLSQESLLFNMEVSDSKRVI